MVSFEYLLNDFPHYIKVTIFLFFELKSDQYIKTLR